MSCNRQIDFRELRVVVFSELEAIQHYLGHTKEECNIKQECVCGLDYLIDKLGLDPAPNIKKQIEFR